MGNLLLKAIAHNHFSHPINPAGAPLDDVFASLAVTVAHNIHLIKESCAGLDDQSATTPHVVNSTIMNMCFTVGDFSLHRFRSMVATRMPSAVPAFILSAYECAGWGYSLRFCLKRFPNAQYVLVTILDANVYDFEFWLYNSNWEKSGFGCTTLLFEKNGPVGDELLVGSVRGNNSLMEFAFAVNRVARGDGGAVVALPCFPQRIFETLTKSLASFEILPNGHSEWGHCFGSDPWLGILKSRIDDGRNAAFIACSLALNGYFCILKVRVHPNISISFSHAPPVEVGAGAALGVTESGAVSLATSPPRKSISSFGEYEGVLTGRPFGHRVTMAQMQPLPLVGEHDFAIAGAFHGSHGTPVLLNYAEHVELLALLVSTFLVQIPELDMIVVRMRLPTQGRLPRELLQDKVLLLDVLTEELGSLNIEHINVLEIEDRFLRHPLEIGDNRIRLRMVVQGAAGRLHDLMPWLANFGIREIKRGSERLASGCS